jgi:hypothetical protein
MVVGCVGVGCISRILISKIRVLIYLINENDIGFGKKGRNGREKRLAWKSSQPGIPGTQAIFL